jgi:multidrug efflux system outer membrane protein
MKSTFFTLAGALGLLAGCSVGPDYHRPSAIQSQPLPATFSTNSTDWKIAQPSAHLPRGQWWKIFDDAELSRLEELAATNNQDLAAAAARFEQARGLVGVARADFYPKISAQPSFTRQRSSINLPENGKPAGTAYTYNTFLAPLELGWELDLWGRVRRQTQGAQARFVAAGDDLESARLSLQADVGSDYFMLRSLETERALVADTITAYRRSLELTQNRRQGGIVSDLDVSQAETQLRTTEAELPALEIQRETLLHALATLCGRAPTGFDLAKKTLDTNSLSILPAYLPSELLERRPDIAASERRMMAANADVGVAKSAFYPRVFLNGMAGFDSLNASSFFDWPSRLWAIGPSLDLPLFTGGHNRAQLAAAESAYDENVANYREQVLTAFQEVENFLTQQRLLTEQLGAQSAAYAAAQHTLDIANNRYKAGLITYLEVATAQSAALDLERTLVQLRGQTLITEVGLIKALGGGWNQPAAK